jgi:hypothetical protein
MWLKNDSGWRALKPAETHIFPKLNANCHDNALIESKLSGCYQYPPTNPSALNSNHLQTFLAKTSEKLFWQFQLLQLDISNEDRQAIQKEMRDIMASQKTMQDFLANQKKSQDCMARVERTTDAEIKDARGEVHVEYVRCGLQQLVHVHFKVPRELEVQPQGAWAPCP